MQRDEVSVESDEDDYEVVPIGPIRKLERRIDSMEEKATQGGGANEEVIRDVLDIMKSNQKIVNDMTESTHQLKNSVEDLTHKMDEVVDNMNSFMDLLKDASEVDMEGEIVGDMQGRIADAIGDRMDDAIKEMQNSNQEIVNSLQDLNKTMRRNYASDNKDNIMNRSRGGGQGNQMQQQQQSGGRNGGQQRNSGNRQRRGRNSNRNNGGSNEDDRMRKLRNRFQSEDE